MIQTKTLSTKRIDAKKRPQPLVPDDARNYSGKRMPAKLKLALAIAGYYALVGVAWWRCGWWVAVWMGLASTLTAAIIYLLTEDDEESK